jgi:hypothetical protein
MLTRSKITQSKTAGSTLVLTAAIILGAVLAAAAKDDGPPTVDIQKTCRESANVLSGLKGTDNQDFDACMSDEQLARDGLVKNWANYPAAAKAQCVKPKEYLPDYVEWQSCLDMTREVMTMRQGGSPSTPASTNSQSPGR